MSFPATNLDVYAIFQLVWWHRLVKRPPRNPGRMKKNDFAHGPLVCRDKGWPWGISKGSHAFIENLVWSYVIIVLFHIIFQSTIESCGLAFLHPSISFDSRQSRSTSEFKTNLMYSIDYRQNPLDGVDGGLRLPMQGPPNSNGLIAVPDVGMFENFHPSLPPTEHDYPWRSAMFSDRSTWSTDYGIDFLSPATAWATQRSL